MTFADEAVRTAFHKLPTHTQYEWAGLEDSLALEGKAIHITDVVPAKDGGAPEVRSIVVSIC